MDTERMQRWTAHCHRMAEATYAIADWCEDTEMMGAYLALAARWLQIAAEGPPAASEAGGRHRVRTCDPLGVNQVL